MNQDISHNHQEEKVFLILIDDLQPTLPATRNPPIR